jgi:hypothetical protein
MRIIITSILALVILWSCDAPTKSEQAIEIPEPVAITVDHHSPTISKVFAAHGGFANWAAMKQLSYTKGGENTVTNLQNRKIRLDSDNQTIGYDGNQVWIAPDTLDASRTRFYHNLYFYFYAMPFVLGDPNTFFEDMPERELAGKSYKGVRVSFGENVGDSPKDYYIVWYDPATFKMEWLMYTVTFKSGEVNENYSLIKYDQWVDVNGMLLPQKLQWYTFKDDVLGDVRNEAIFENIKLSTEAPADSLFVMPANAKVAP